MQVTIRLDDITPDMDWGKFNYFESILDELGIKPIIGVVPNNEDDTLHIEDNNPVFWDEVRRLRDKGWVIAMHGFNHVYTTDKGGLFPLNHFSEFAGVDYEMQLKKITEGRKALLEQGISADVFMAPGHTFDKNTVKALKENGFKAITDGFGRKPYKRDGIIYYPIAERRGSVFEDDNTGRTTLIYHLNMMTMDDINLAAVKLRQNRDKLINFELIDNADNQSGIQRFLELMKANTKRILVSIRNK
ncbi:hypothetical protein SAMN02910368_01850 [Lachnospiraceae bacterium G11]|nr:hypothetical protein SAMN02910368_01850 [Lachnospiraceae bacterium G11]